MFATKSLKHFTLTCEVFGKTRKKPSVLYISELDMQKESRSVRGKNPKYAHILYPYQNIERVRLQWTKIKVKHISLQNN